MDNVVYQKLLFRAAIGVMASDGEIHEDEVHEIELACKNSGFFNNITYNDELKSVLDEIEAGDSVFMERLISDMKSYDMTPAQELQLLEVVLRIIYADGRIDDNELKFLELVKKQLSIPESIFQMRFGGQENINAAKSKMKEIPSTHEFLESLARPKEDEVIIHTSE